MEHVELWLKFLVAAGIVIVAGLSLTRNAEKLADAMGWGHAFAGFIVLGWATSLPEVTISLSAVTSVGSAALSSGNITGSIIFNLAILALLDILARGPRTGTEDGVGVIPLGVFNLIMLGGTLAVALWPDSVTGSLAPTGALFLLVLYVGSTVHCYRTQQAPDEPESSEPRPVRRPVIVRCLLAGAAILAAGLWLTHIGDDLARTYSLEEGLVGTIFLASVSSLPELVTGLAAMRLGLMTMAAASILGSNIFNLGILGAADLTYQATVQAGRPLIAAADDPRMAFNLGAAMAMTLLALGVTRMRRAQAARATLRGLAALSLMIYVGAIAGS